MGHWILVESGGENGSKLARKKGAGAKKAGGMNAKKLKKDLGHL